MSVFALDHVGFIVGDLDAAAERFVRLGFNLTPRGHHVLPPLTPGGAPRPAGTSNHCAMLGRGYLELLGITDATYAGSLRGRLERYEGLHIVAFGAPDWAAAQHVLRDGRIADATVRPLQRPIDGGLARFQIIDFPTVPEGVFFAIHHDTPELLWQPELLEHPNGAIGLDSVTVAVADPAGFAARLGHLLTGATTTETIELASGRVRIVDAAWLAANLPRPTPTLPYVAGITLRSCDLAGTAALLRANGVDVREHAGGLLVPPEQACGGFIEFVG
jgi:catechol 2,3-dioxygenase-like lactoylglutathione lyase family enzyme